MAGSIVGMRGGEQAAIDIGKVMLAIDFFRRGIHDARPVVPEWRRVTPRMVECPKCGAAPYTACATGSKTKTCYKRHRIAAASERASRHANEEGMRALRDWISRRQSCCRCRIADE